MKPGPELLLTCLTIIFIACAEQQGFGRYVREDGISFDPDFLKGFGVVRIRRQKNKSENFEDSFQRMKGSRRAFKLGEY